MKSERFSLDTNILIYSTDTAAGDRFRLAAAIVDRAPLCECRIGLQAISEFYVAATRKGKLSRRDAELQAGDWLTLFQTVAPSREAARRALRTASAGDASYWDALLLATVAEAGCTAMLTEDMADGTTLLGVRIVNPFDGAALAPAAKALLRTDES
jgi:predicted nucleic acid-binding protein